jgi:hypothetical protein
MNIFSTVFVATSLSALLLLLGFSAQRVQQVFLHGLENNTAHEVILPWLGKVAFRHPTLQFALLGVAFAAYSLTLGL